MVRRLSFSLIAAAAAMALSAPLHAAPKASVSVQLSADRTALSAADDVNVRFTIRNDGARARNVFVWDTPLIEVENDLFLVQRDGVRVDYLGYIAKRGNPEPADFVRLGRGQSRSTTVELSALYDMSRGGTYTIQYRAGLAGLVPSIAADAGESIMSNALTVEIRGDSAARARSNDELFAPAGDTDLAAQYTRCSLSQTDTLANLAFPASQTYATNAVSWLATHNSATDTRYKTWFGAYDAARYAKVQANFNKIKEALDTKQIVFNCGCKKTYYAYVYPSQPYQIYLCKAFWTAPTTGTDSKAGTIIHEVSHFTVVAGTDDWAYGHTAAKNLANTEPAKAVDNADSHEYYSEY